MTERYRPSNGTEGEAFMDRWCRQCIHEQGDRECSILTRTMIHDVNEPEYPDEWQKTDEGPVCTAFDSGARDNRCPNTIDMLEDSNEQ